MPNRNEIPSPAMRAKNAVKRHDGSPDAEAWTIIAFCAIGWLMAFYIALSTVGVDTFPKMMAQVPWG